MDQPDKLIRRLCKAKTKHSLRALAWTCDVSHETIRKILNSESVARISMANYEKIDKGLKANGF